MKTLSEKCRHGFKNGVQKGWRGYIWLLKILVPISFLTALLDYSGLLKQIDFILRPVMGLLHLPPEAALPIIAGMLTGIYGAVAALMVLGLSVPHMTLCAIFALISHNLIQEGVIQGKSGINPIKATVFRLSASVVTVYVAGLFLTQPSADMASAAAGSVSQSAHPAFMEMIVSWAAATFWLGLKILAIIMTLMVVLEILKAVNAIPKILRFLKPALKVMGIDPEVGLMWLAAIFFGISYGAAVIVEEADGGDFDKQNLEKLHLSIGINHAIIEDPALFLPLGIGAFWLWVPRIITALVAVRLLGLYHRFKFGKSARFTPTISGSR